MPHVDFSRNSPILRQGRGACSDGPHHRGLIRKTARHQWDRRGHGCPGQPPALGACPWELGHFLGGRWGAPPEPLPAARADAWRPWPDPSAQGTRRTPPITGNQGGKPQQAPRGELMQAWPEPHSIPQAPRHRMARHAAAGGRRPLRDRPACPFLDMRPSGFCERAGFPPSEWGGQRVQAWVPSSAGLTTGKGQLC